MDAGASETWEGSGDLVAVSGPGPIVRQAVSCNAKTFTNIM